VILVDLGMRPDGIHQIPLGQMMAFRTRQAAKYIERARSEGDEFAIPRQRAAKHIEAKRSEFNDGAKFN